MPPTHTRGVSDRSKITNIGSIVRLLLRESEKIGASFNPDVYPTFVKILEHHTMAFTDGLISEIDTPQAEEMLSFFTTLFNCFGNVPEYVLIPLFDKLLLVLVDPQHVGQSQWIGECLFAMSRHISHLTMLQIAALRLKSAPISLPLLILLHKLVALDYEVTEEVLETLDDLLVVVHNILRTPLTLELRAELVGLVPALLRFDAPARDAATPCDSELEHAMLIVVGGSGGDKGNKGYDSVDAKKKQAKGWKIRKNRGGQSSNNESVGGESINSVNSVNSFSGETRGANMSSQRALFLGSSSFHKAQPNPSPCPSNSEDQEDPEQKSGMGQGDKTQMLIAIVSIGLGLLASDLDERALHMVIDALGYLATLVDLRQVAETIESLVGLMADRLKSASTGGSTGGSSICNSSDIPGNSSVDGLSINTGNTPQPSSDGKDSPHMSVLKAISSPALVLRALLKLCLGASDERGAKVGSSVGVGAGVGASECCVKPRKTTLVATLDSLLSALDKIDRVIAPSFGTALDSQQLGGDRRRGSFDGAMLSNFFSPLQQLAQQFQLSSASQTESTIMSEAGATSGRRRGKDKWSNINLGSFGDTTATSTGQTSFPSSAGGSAAFSQPQSRQLLMAQALVRTTRNNLQSTSELTLRLRPTAMLLHLLDNIQGERAVQSNMLISSPVVSRLLDTPRKQELHNKALRPLRKTKHRPELLYALGRLGIAFAEPDIVGLYLDELDSPRPPSATNLVQSEIVAANCLASVITEMTNDTLRATLQRLFKAALNAPLFGAMPIITLASRTASLAVARGIWPRSGCPELSPILTRLVFLLALRCYAPSSPSQQELTDFTECLSSLLLLRQDESYTQSRILARLSFPIDQAQLCKAFYKAYKADNPLNKFVETTSARENNHSIHIVAPTLNGRPGYLFLDLLESPSDDLLRIGAEDGNMSPCAAEPTTPCSIQSDEFTSHSESAPDAASNAQRSSSARPESSLDVPNHYGGEVEDRSKVPNTHCTSESDANAPHSKYPNQSGRQPNGIEESNTESDEVCGACGVQIVLLGHLLKMLLLDIREGQLTEIRSGHQLGDKPVLVALTTLTDTYNAALRCDQSLVEKLGGLFGYSAGLLLVEISESGLEGALRSLVPRLSPYASYLVFARLSACKEHISEKLVKKFVLPWVAAQCWTDMLLLRKPHKFTDKLAPVLAGTATDEASISAISSAYSLALNGIYSPDLTDAVRRRAEALVQLKARGSNSNNTEADERVVGLYSFFLIRLLGLCVHAKLLPSSPSIRVALIACLHSSSNSPIAKAVVEVAATVLAADVVASGACAVPAGVLSHCSLVDSLPDSSFLVLAQAVVRELVPVIDNDDTWNSPLPRVSKEADNALVHLLARLVVTQAGDKASRSLPLSYFLTGLYLRLVGGTIPPSASHIEGDLYGESNKLLGIASFCKNVGKTDKTLAATLVIHALDTLETPEPAGTAQPSPNSPNKRRDPARVVSAFRKMLLGAEPLDGRTALIVMFKLSCISVANSTRKEVLHLLDVMCAIHPHQLADILCCLSRRSMKSLVAVLGVGITQATREALLRALVLKQLDLFDYQKNPMVSPQTLMALLEEAYPTHCRDFYSSHLACDPIQPSAIPNRHILRAVTSLVELSSLSPNTVSVVLCYVVMCLFALYKTRTNTTRYDKECADNVVRLFKLLRGSNVRTYPSVEQEPIQFVLTLLNCMHDSQLHLDTEYQAPFGPLVSVMVECVGSGGGGEAVAADILVKRCIDCGNALEDPFSSLVLLGVLVHLGCTNIGRMLPLLTCCLRGFNILGEFVGLIRKLVPVGVVDGAHLTMPKVEQRELLGVLDAVVDVAYRSEGPKTEDFLLILSSHLDMEGLVISDLDQGTACRLVPFVYKANQPLLKIIERSVRPLSFPPPQSLCVCLRCGLGKVEGAGNPDADGADGSHCACEDVFERLVAKLDLSTLIRCITALTTHSPLQAAVFTKDFLQVLIDLDPTCLETDDVRVMFVNVVLGLLSHNKDEVRVHALQALEFLV